MKVTFVQKTFLNLKGTFYLRNTNKKCQEKVFHLRQGCGGQAVL